MKSRHWSVAGAKAALSQVLHQTADGPQVIENRGRPVAVVVSYGDFQQEVGEPSASMKGSKWQRFLVKSASCRAKGGGELAPTRRGSRRDPFGRR